MSSSPREIVCREFKNNERMFLNYESQRKVALGDIVIWDGWDAQFEIVSRLSELRLKPRIQTSSVKSTQLFNSTTGVEMEFQEKGKVGGPTMHFRYGGSSRYSLQAFDTTVESLDEVALAADITENLKNASLEWDNDWIVVTTVWNAAAYSQLVASGREASAGVCATTGAVSGPFNIADLTLKVSLGYGSGLCSQQIAGVGACPFFIGMKYRVRGRHLPHMARYGG